MADEANERLTREERVARIEELRTNVQSVFTENEGTEWPDSVREEWNAFNSELERQERILKEDDAARERVAEIATRNENTDAPEPFQTRRPSSPATRDIYDPMEVRRTARNIGDEQRMLHDNAMTAAERGRYYHPRADKQSVQEGIERLLSHDDPRSEIAKAITTTGSDIYRQAFSKRMAGRGLSTAEHNAMDLAQTERAFTDASTGVPLPFTLDPTLIHTSNYSVNPFRAIARVETIAGTNNWHGATSGSITTAYAAEAAETTDNTPTLTQPSVTVLRAQAFVPLSFEVAADWSAVFTEMASLLQEGKDDLEATKFYSGTGTVEPQGIQNGLTTGQRTQTAGTAALVVGDVYNTQGQLAPRWQSDASWVMHLRQANRIRQFDTAGGAQLWIDNLRGGLTAAVGGTNQTFGASLLGYPAYSLSTSGTAIASGSKIAIVGAFNRGFLIADRVGMNVEVIPHLFGTVANFPTGQRGIFAYWRNTSAVLVAGAFQYLEAL